MKDVIKVLDFLLRLALIGASLDILVVNFRDNGSPLLMGFWFSIIVGNIILLKEAIRYL